MVLLVLSPRPRLELVPRFQVNQAAVIERPHALREGERARKHRDEIVENLTPAVPLHGQGVTPRPGHAEEMRRKQEGTGEVPPRHTRPPTAAGQQAHSRRTNHPPTRSWEDVEAERGRGEEVAQLVADRVHGGLKSLTRPKGSRCLVVCLGLAEGTHRFDKQVVRFALHPQDAGQELQDHVALEKGIRTPRPRVPPLAARRRPVLAARRRPGLRGKPIPLEPRRVRARRARRASSRERPRAVNDGGCERARRKRRRRTPPARCRRRSLWPPAEPRRGRPVDHHRPRAKEKADPAQGTLGARGDVHLHHGYDHQRTLSRRPAARQHRQPVSNRKSPQGIGPALPIPSKRERVPAVQAPQVTVELAHEEHARFLFAHITLHQQELGPKEAPFDVPPVEVADFQRKHVGHHHIRRAPGHRGRGPERSEEHGQTQLVSTGTATGYPYPHPYLYPYA